MRATQTAAALAMSLLLACGGGGGAPADAGSSSASEDDGLTPEHRAAIAAQQALHATLASRAATDANFRQASAKASQQLGVSAEALRFGDRTVGALLVLPHRKDLQAKLIALQDAVAPLGVTALLSRGMHVGKPMIALYPSADPWELARAIGLDGAGIEWQGAPLDCERLIGWAKDLRQRHPYRLLGLSHDTLLLRFEAPIADANKAEALARELTAICPIFEDEERPGELARQLQRARELTLFWD